MSEEKFPQQIWTREAAGLVTKGLECRNLKLKGKSKEVLTWIVKLV